MYIENIVIGKPICSPEEMFAKDIEDWTSIEQEKTYFTNEKFLPKILAEIGVAPSTSEVRRNRKDLIKTLDSLNFLEIKYGKRKLYILVGEEDS